MMAALRGNRLLPVLALLVAGLVVFIAYRSWSAPDIDPGQPVMAELPKTPAPDADSPAETVKTLSAQVADVQKRMKDQNERSEQLLRQKEDLRRELEARQAEDMRQRQSEDKSAFEALTQRIDDLSGRVSTLAAARGDPAAPQDTHGDIPPGLGLDDPGHEAPAAPDRESLVWTEALGQREVATTGALQRVSNVLSETADKAGGLLEEGREQAGEALDSARSRVSDAVSEPAEKNSTPRALEPRYTINRNATLMGATAWTALIGRIPINGTVSDPVPFKVLVGVDNLAANGLTLPPELRGMVMSGVAIGDLTLKCVFGRLTSATFVFADGTIRTEAAEGNGSLGTITDRHGTCVSGELITNAPAFLAQRTGVMALETAAEAAAAAQTTTDRTALGTSVSAVTGDANKYVLGKTLAGGASEIRRWFDERQKQSFDAIFVRPGESLVLNIDQELHIDYDPNGRRLDHAQGSATQRRARLD